MKCNFFWERKCVLVLSTKLYHKKQTDYIFEKKKKNANLRGPFPTLLLPLNIVSHLFNLIIIYFLEPLHLLVKWVIVTDFKKLFLKTGVESRIFIWRGQVVALIYLSRQLSTQTYKHVFFIIYTHQKKKSIFNQNYVWWWFFIK